MKGAQHSCLRDVRTAQILQVLLYSVPGRLALAQVIADVHISTVVHNLKVARGTQRGIIGYALSSTFIWESDFEEIGMHPFRG